MLDSGGRKEQRDAAKSVIVDAPTEPRGVH